MQNELDPKGMVPWPLGGYAPGSYSCRCLQCEKEFIGDKRASQCLECAVIDTKRHLSATVPAGDGEPVAYINAQGGVLMTEVGMEWFKGIRAQIAPVGSPAAPLYASRLSQGTGDSERVKALEHEISVHRGAIRRLLDEKGDLGSTMFAKGVLDREMPALSGDTL